ncbi:hypothetical protein DL96DRAFT_294289 [Flagelloscypha sp. PMI_526]|nr:hypothetical protein DL96DRAFT_294289 [Flagelloscypha sp. PMI_526]
MEHRPSVNQAKKRHTKPCKFFQAGACRLSSENCDFAHASDSFTASYTPSCNYFSTGHCDAIGHCPYPHPGNEAMYGYSKKQEYSPAIVPYPLQVGGYASPMSPQIYACGTPTSPISAFPSNFHRVPSEASIIESPTTSSSGSLDEPLSIDDVSYRSVNMPSFTNPFNAGAAVPLSMPISLSEHPMAAQKMTRSRSRSTGPSKRKLSKYKTKRCKFWTPETGCPNGPSCTFVHGDEAETILPRPAVGHGVPSKPVSVQEANAQKGYYPVNWRVIGGGVKMGVDHEPTQSAEFVPSSHSYDEDSSSSATSTASPGFRRRRSNSNPDAPNLEYSQAKSFHAET